MSCATVRHSTPRSHLAVQRGSSPRCLRGFDARTLAGQPVSGRLSPRDGATAGVRRSHGGARSSVGRELTRVWSTNACRNGRRCVTFSRLEGWRRTAMTTSTRRVWTSEFSPLRWASAPARDRYPGPNTRQRVPPLLQCLQRRNGTSDRPRNTAATPTFPPAFCRQLRLSGCCMRPFGIRSKRRKLR